jgi:tellurite resistance protein
MKRKLSVDESLIALFIAAMDANGHVSPAELERAHHLIWSTRRFRQQDGDEVNRIISDMRARIGSSDAEGVLAVAVKAIPARLREPAFVVLADLLLADGQLDVEERAFLRRAGNDLQIAAATQRRIVDVVLLKNQL